MTGTAKLIEEFHIAYKNRRALARYFGAYTCPMCSPQATTSGNGRMVVYRSSNKSATFKCKFCEFQYTFTYHKLIQALNNLKTLVKGTNVYGISKSKKKKQTEIDNAINYIKSITPEETRSVIP